MFRVAFNQQINFAGAIQRDAEQVFRKSTHVCINAIALFPERTPDIIASLLAHVGLEKHLERKFAGFSAGAHFWSLVAGLWSLALSAMLSVYREIEVED